MILVFDTSTGELAVALADSQSNVIGEYHASATKEERGIHDKRLASESKRLMDHAGITARQLDKIGFVVGPGSFTGLRIGISFAKGLSYAVDIPLVPVTAHRLLFASGIESEYIVTPGYQPKLLYVARAETPDIISLVTAQEFSAMPEGSILAHESLRESEALPKWPTRFAAPSMKSLAEIAQSESGLIGEAIDQLEPLYLTEFNPK